jgi:hypothetical protein
VSDIGVPFLHKQGFEIGQSEVSNARVRLGHALSREMVLSFLRGLDTKAGRQSNRARTESWKWFSSKNQTQQQQGELTRV